MTERVTFIPDRRGSKRVDDLTTQEKNAYLAARLNGSLANRLIVQIDRIEIGSKGWRVTYRV